MFASVTALVFQVYGIWCTSLPLAAQDWQDKESLVSVAVTQTTQLSEVATLVLTTNKRSFFLSANVHLDLCSTNLMSSLNA